MILFTKPDKQIKSGWGGKCSAALGSDRMLSVYAVKITYGLPSSFIQGKLSPVGNTNV